jgi:hypothetical protein
MKIGYKGFDKNLKCKDHQLQTGEVASKPEKDNPRTCSNDGFHYCNKLEDCFTYYSLNRSNRYCEIEILGNFKDDGDKSVTTSLKIIREIPLSEIYEKQIEQNMNLEKVRKLQKAYPLIHVGGSIGLFLQGIRLKRWKDSTVGIDIVSPYFQLFESFDDCCVDYQDCKKSGNDFDEVFILDSVKVDCRIDPHQRYEVVEYKGFKYKVSKFETIMAAKMKYAANGQDKHKDDIREMCKLNKPLENVNDAIDSDLLF